MNLLSPDFIGEKRNNVLARNYSPFRHGILAVMSRDVIRDGGQILRVICNSGAIMIQEIEYLNLYFLIRIIFLDDAKAILSFLPL